MEVSFQPDGPVEAFLVPDYGIHTLGEPLPGARAGNASAGRPTRIIIRAAKGESWQRERWERESWQRERWETTAS